MIISYARSKYLLPCIDSVNLTEQTADDALLMTIKEINTAYGKMFGSLFAFPSRLEKIPLMGTTFGAV